MASKRAEILRENEISMLREKLKKLENLRDLEAIEAEYNAYAAAEGNDVVEGAEVGNTSHAIEASVHINKPSFKTSQIDSAPIPITTKTELNLREDSLVQSLKESLLISKLPTPEPFVFTGDSLKFIEWSTTFKALMEMGCINSAYKLFYLKKYIGGETFSTGGDILQNR